MLKDYKFNIVTYLAVFLFGLIAIFAFMTLMASRMTWTDVNKQFLDTTFYIFFAMLIIVSMMFSIEKRARASGDNLEAQGIPFSAVVDLEDIEEYAMHT